MLPITTGIVPFGAVMGSVCADANLTLFQSGTMNTIIFAGAAQLAAIDLMLQGTSSFVIIATALIINLRFMLYSAALSPTLKNSKLLTKLFCSYTLTDQTYTVLMAHKKSLKSSQDTILFYFGTATCMLIAWHSAVIAGYIFGNFAPQNWSLEYAVPLSFVALIVPSLLNRKYVLVALSSSALSLLLFHLPLNLGLIVTVLLSLGLAALLTRETKKIKSPHNTLEASK